MGRLPRKAATPRISSPGADDPYSSWGLTFVLGSEFAHLSWESLVELVFPWDQRLAQGRLVEAEHTRVPPNLVDKGLQQDALGTGLHVHSPESWAHPPGAGGREKGEEAGSSGQRVLRLPSVCASVCLATAPQLRGTGRSAGSKQWQELEVAFQPSPFSSSGKENRLKTLRAPPITHCGPASSRKNKQPELSRGRADADRQGQAPGALRSPCGEHNTTPRQGSHNFKPNFQSA